MALSVLVEGAGAAVERLAIRRLDLVPAAADDRDVEIVLGVGQFTLRVDVADGRGLHAETDIGAFWHDRLVGAVRHALGALALIKKVGKLGAGALVTGGVDVRDVVRDDFEIGLLGIHARCCDGKRSHVFVLKL